MDIPLTINHVVPVSCTGQTPGWKHLSWLFDQRYIRPEGRILRMNFDAPYRPMLSFDYAQARTAFEDEQVREYFGPQGCGRNAQGGMFQILSHNDLLDHILPASPTSLLAVAHTYAHALIPMVNALLFERLPKDGKMRIYERVGFNPDVREELVIAFYIEPGYLLERGTGKTESLRANLALSFLQDLFDGNVNKCLLEQHQHIEAIEQAVRPKVQGPFLPFTRPGHHEGNPAPSWPYAG